MPAMLQSKPAIGLSRTRRCLRARSAICRSNKTVLTCVRSLAFEDNVEVLGILVPQQLSELALELLLPIGSWVNFNLMHFAMNAHGHHWGDRIQLRWSKDRAPVWVLVATKAALALLPGR